MTAAVRPDATTLGAFALFVFVGGTNFVAVRFSNFELPPLWGAATRFALAALLFFAVMALRRAPFPRGRALVGALLYGVFSFGAFYGLVYYALVFVQAGLAAVILGLVPLVTLLLAPLHRLEPFRWLGLAGSLLAASGVGVIFWYQLGSDVPPAALVALLGGAVAGAEGGIIVKRFPPVDLVSMNAIGMATGAALLYLGSEAAHELHVIPVEAETWTAFVYLVTVGSLALFFLFLFVLRRWTASATAYSFVLFPVVATGVAFWLAGEEVTGGFVAGSVLVLVGVYVGALRRPRTPVPPASARGPRDTG